MSITLEEKLASALRNRHLYSHIVKDYEQAVAEQNEIVSRTREQIRSREPYVEDLTKWADGTVIRWEEPGFAYGQGYVDLTLAAVKGGGRWYLSRTNGEIKTSEDLRTYLRRSTVKNVELLSSHRVIKKVK